MRSKLFLVTVSILASVSVFASLPANRRTILTSGDIVYPIRYQLGQSTVISFGFKPETVICGNKNYFNIERIKEGLTIQPLSSLSTNLTVISGEKRFLFYLTPSGRAQPDGFVDVKWVSPSEITSLKTLTSATDEVTQVSTTLALSLGTSLRVIDLLSSSVRGPSIVNFEFKNDGRSSVNTADLRLAVLNARQPVESQMTVWEKDVVGPKEAVKGRVIFGHGEQRKLRLVVRYGVQTKQVLLKASRH